MARDKKKSVRLSTREDLLIRKKAAQANMDVSTYMRKAALKHPVIVISGIKNLHLQVAKVGNNLNQLTMLCHQGAITAIDLSECLEVLDQIYLEFQKIGDVVNRKEE